MNSRAAILVGSVLIFATVALTIFVLFTTKDHYAQDSTYPLYADFHDASGIRWKTRIQINGIDVGKIVSVKHVKNSKGRLIGRVEIRILNDFSIYANASIRKAAESLLGDFRLDLDPGDASYKKLAPGGIIDRVQSTSDIDLIQERLKDVIGNVNDITENFSKVLAGPEGEGSLKAILERVETSMEAIEKTTSVLAGTLSRNDQAVDRIVHNLADFSQSIARSGAPHGSLTRLLDHMANISAKLESITFNVNDMLAADVGQAEHGALRQSIENLNESLIHLTGISRKINTGSGTLGQLINDPRLAEKVEETLDDASELIGSLSRLQTEVELRSEYGVPFDDENQEIQSAIKNTIGVRIIPKPDKYYLLEAIADPRGRTSRRITTTSQDGSTGKVETSEISFNELKFSAQFAKRYAFLTLRFGIIENTGGLGTNLHAFEDNLELRLDVFDFDRRDPDDNKSIKPRFRAAAMFELATHLYLQGGLDDPFNQNLRTWFLGGVIRFNDQDLKALLSIAPSL
jgi:phospholipid/cholesterol/gamma-HCH transport system substrate-binding protein